MNNFKLIEWSPIFPTMKTFSISSEVTVEQTYKISSSLFKSSSNKKWSQPNNRFQDFLFSPKCDLEERKINKSDVEMTF